MKSQEVRKFYNKQLCEWPEFAEHVAELEKIETRAFDFGSYKIIAQYNPARAFSSNAKLDEKSIQARKCFLCAANRPACQRELRLSERFVLLVNPFPILKEHFTIPFVEHRKQEILPYVDDMLQIAQSLSEYMIFYNGPKAGASAPDHMHFQAVQRGQLPLEDEYKTLNKKILSENKYGQMSELENFGRRCILIESTDAQMISSFFNQLYVQFQLFTNTKEEPLMNIFLFQEEKKWTMFVFPRKTHRPSQFYAEGKDKKIISPGAIDIAGVLVLPRKEDFDSLTKDLISDVFRQVSL